MSINTQRFILFLVLNFFGLYLGSLTTSVAVNSDWYMQLQKAPWTPPGWVFGAAWTTIMVCFTFYMTIAINRRKNNVKLITLYLLQWGLNFLWNPLFFYYHQVFFALVVIVLLTVLLFLIFLFNYKKMKHYSLLIAPYIVWLLIATSLNLYIYLYN